MNYGFNAAYPGLGRGSDATDRRCWLRLASAARPPAAHQQNESASSQHCHGRRFRHSVGCEGQAERRVEFGPGGERADQRPGRAVEADDAVCVKAAPVSGYGRSRPVVIALKKKPLVMAFVVPLKNESTSQSKSRCPFVQAPDTAQGLASIHNPSDLSARHKTGYAASACSFTPSALATFSTVAKEGLPSALSAR